MISIGDIVVPLSVAGDTVAVKCREVGGKLDGIVIPVRTAGGEYLPVKVSPTKKNEEVTLPVCTADGEVAVATGGGSIGLYNYTPFVNVPEGSWNSSSKTMTFEKLENVNQGVVGGIMMWLGVDENNFTIPIVKKRGGSELICIHHILEKMKLTGFGEDMSIISSFGLSYSCRLITEPFDVSESFSDLARIDWMVGGGGSVSNYVIGGQDDRQDEFELETTTGDCSFYARWGAHTVGTIYGVEACITKYESHTSSEVSFSILDDKVLSEIIT